MAKACDAEHEDVIFIRRTLKLVKFSSHVHESRAGPILPQFFNRYQNECYQHLLTVHRA